MSEPFKLKDGLNSELWPDSLHRITSNEVKDEIFKEFSVYFENEQMLKLAIENGFLLYDYNTFCRDYKNSIFAAFLLTIIDIYNTAKQRCQNECFSFFLSYEPSISRAFQNTTSVAYTQQDKNIERLDLYAKVCFRELGDFIEGSFQPFIKELLGLHLLKKNNSSQVTEIIEKVSLGDAVTALIDAYEDLSVLYKYVLYGVPLNQWRNIANHNSYSIHETTNSIQCNYGRKGYLKSVVLSRSDLTTLCISVPKIHYLHKMAHAFFLTDNLYSMPAKPTNIKITEDTAIMQAFEILACSGFKVQAYKKIDDEYFFSINDTEFRNSEEIEQAFNQLTAGIFAMLGDASFDVYDTRGMVVARANISES